MIKKNECFRSEDLIADLRKFVDRDVKHYQSDFEYDKEIFLIAAKDREKRDFIWITRDCGTSCLYERNAYIKESYGHAECMTFLSESSARAYIIDIDKNEKDRVIGKVYPLDKNKLFNDIKRHSVSAKYVEIDPVGGKLFRIPYSDYNANPYRYVQNLEAFTKEYFPDGEDAVNLYAHLKELKSQRQEIYNLDLRISKTKDILVNSEKNDSVKEVQKQR